MVLPEYERIAQSCEKTVTSAVNIAFIDEGMATGEVAELYSYFRDHFGRQDVPGILKCFATHPSLLRHMMEMSESLIFADGFLSRKHKEMIATLVSAQNLCPYCADSHGYFLRMQGCSTAVLEAIQDCNLRSSALTEAEQALLTFARQVNIDSHKIVRTDVEMVMQAGWSESQVAETVHVAALFSAFNRVANAFGLASQGLLALYDSAPTAAKLEK